MAEVVDNGRMRWIAFKTKLKGKLREGGRERECVCVLVCVMCMCE